MHEGHRGRMIEKLMATDSLPEHELIEILLFNAIPRKNTNDIAHRLLERFGNISNLFNATVEQLQGVEGVGSSTAAYLKVVGLLIRKYEPSKECVQIFDRETFPQYLKNRYEGINYEILDVYVLDNSLRFKTVKSFSNISKTSVEVDPKLVTKFLIDSNAYAAVLAHNHPEEKSRPTREDDNFTKQCQIVCSINNIRLLDHLICGEDGVYSYFASGKLHEINRKYSIHHVLEENE